MPRHDWEALHDELVQATSGHDRAELVSLLRDLIREYVIERAMPTGTPAQAIGLDLSQMDFATLIGHLKRTCQAPELSLFSVDGRRVVVDLDGPREVRAPARSSAAATPIGQPSLRPAPAPAGPSTGPTAGLLAGPAASPPPATATVEGEDGRPGEKPPVSKRFKHLEFD